MVRDLPSDLLHHVSHRPWPLPTGHWIMTQSWHDLLFAHWKVDVSVLRARVPSALDLDLFNGQAWLGIVPFYMSNVAPRWMPALPFVSAFAELNVRTYVTHGGRAGVYFFSLDAGSRLAVATARTLFRLPYYFAEMDLHHDGDDVVYRSRRRSEPHAEWRARYRPIGPARFAERGSLDYFLTERYCLYTVSGSQAYRLEIHHPPWSLQAAHAEIEVNTMTDGLTGHPILHFSKRQDVLAWPMERV